MLELSPSILCFYSEYGGLGFITSQCFIECCCEYVNHRFVVVDYDNNLCFLKHLSFQSLLERHKEFTNKLEEVCDNLTLTENHLMGHQQQADSTETVTDLQQYQQEHQVPNTFPLHSFLKSCDRVGSRQFKAALSSAFSISPALFLSHIKALQKDVLTNASALNEVISSTKKFLEENRNKLTPDQIASIEGKLDEAKSKAKLINQRAEESRKDLEKVVTTAIKQESEKVRLPPYMFSVKLRKLY